MTTTMKRTGIILLMLIVALAFTLEPSMAATKKMTVYSQVYKTGSTAYCLGDSGIYKVNLKTKAVKRIVKTTRHSQPMNIKKKGSYIYYINFLPGDYSLCRVHIKTGKKKTLAYGVAGYAISGKKIYYGKYNYDTNKTSKRVMKLNGKNKKKTSIRGDFKEKKTNVKGYKIITQYPDEEGVSSKDWLKTPSGEKIYLGALKY